MTRARRFAVIGDPIAHSKSPAMHAAAYRALGLPHTYEAIHAREEDLPRLVASLRAGELDGLNVTVPHKARVLALVDEPAPSARLVHAANTLSVMREGGAARVLATNTDVPALARELARLAPARTPEAWRRSRAIVLGSGGAARAAVAALAHELGVGEIVVRARRPEAVVPVPEANVVVEPLAPSSRDAEALTVVQCTTAGMRGADPGELVADAVAWGELPSSAVALDVVYAPPDTAFLARARARALPCVNGLGMLVEQGALAFELWLGVEAPRGAMRAALS